MLQEIYQAPPTKIDLIPHGIPDVGFVDPTYFKDQFGVEGRVVLLTFGLLSPNKGIEYVLNALPHILAEFPDVVYIVLGATHPNELREHGEAYRLSLEILAKKNKLEKNVIFYNRFVELENLKEFIGAADFYITPYLNEAQITSGTLAYTFGAGKATGSRNSSSSQPSGCTSFSSEPWRKARLPRKIVPFRDTRFCQETTRFGITLVENHNKGNSITLITHRRQFSIRSRSWYLALQSGQEQSHEIQYKRSSLCIGNGLGSSDAGDGVGQLPLGQLWSTVSPDYVVRLPRLPRHSQHLRPHHRDCLRSRRWPDRRGRICLALQPVC
jgi:hypothetical protein